MSVLQERLNISLKENNLGMEQKFVLFTFYCLS